MSVGCKIGIIMMNIEKINRKELNQVAVDLLDFLLQNGMIFERVGGYWKNQTYYYVKYNGEYVCFILFNAVGGEVKFSPLTVWTDDSDSSWYKECKIDETAKKIATKHIDICERCGSCGGGTTKKIFGKEYCNVCKTTFRFINPNNEELNCLKQLLLLRKNDIERKIEK